MQKLGRELIFFQESFDLAQLFEEGEEKTVKKEEKKEKKKKEEKLPKRKSRKEVSVTLHKATGDLYF